MHISDGVLSAPVWISSYGAAALITALSLHKMRVEDTPKIAVVASFFFVASLIHIPLVTIKVHLVLNGLAGVLLGLQAFPCILVGLFLQAALFGHGGLTSLGANALVMGLPALLSSLIFQFRTVGFFRLRRSTAVLAFIAGAVSVLSSALLLSLALITTGEEFTQVAWLAVYAHLPVMGIEGIVTAFAVSFLQKVKPEILEDR